MQRLQLRRSVVRGGVRRASKRGAEESEEAKQVIWCFNWIVVGRWFQVGAGVTNFGWMGDRADPRLTTGLGLFMLVEGALCAQKLPKPGNWRQRGAPKRSRGEMQLAKERWASLSSSIH